MATPNVWQIFQLAQPQSTPSLNRQAAVGNSMSPSFTFNYLKPRPMAWMKPLKFVILISWAFFCQFLVVKMPLRRRFFYHFSPHIYYSNDVLKTSSENGNGSRGKRINDDMSSDERLGNVCATRERVLQSKFKHSARLYVQRGGRRPTAMASAHYNRSLARE